MPRQKMLDPCALGDHFWPITRIPSNGGWVARQPIFEQIVDHGVKPLLRRIPRLYQIKANLHLIDRADRRFRRSENVFLRKTFGGQVWGTQPALGVILAVGSLARPCPPKALRRRKRDTTGVASKALYFFQQIEERLNQI
jgi:hypothetical protein